MNTQQHQAVTALRAALNEAVQSELPKAVMKRALAAVALAEAAFPPALDCDRWHDTVGNRPLTPDMIRERAIVWQLCRFLGEQGIVPHAVDDGGDDHERVTTPKALMEAAFAVDWSYVFFRKPGHKPHYVMLVCGNGDEIISDWNYAVDDADGFNAAMDAFCKILEGAA